MNNDDLAHYIEQQGFLKPWLLVQLRLKKLEEQRQGLSTATYCDRLADIHRDLMNLGEWWVGIEDEVF